MRKVELPRLCAFRMCHECNQVQPPRTFHCDVCQRCVLKGDHHCFWTGNCIGLRNQKFFLQYLFYMWLGTGYIGLLLTDFLTISAMELVNMMFDSFNLIVITFLSMGIAFCMFLMLCINVKLILFNQIAMEMAEARNLGDVSRGLNFCYYDKGSKTENIKEALGVNKWWQLFVPVKPEEREFSRFTIPHNLATLRY